MMPLGSMMLAQPGSGHFGLVEVVTTPIATSFVLATFASLVLGCSTRDARQGEGSPGNQEAAPGSFSSAGDAGVASAGDPCMNRTSLGDRICCGRTGEVRNVSCIDLSDGGTIYGSLGRCVGQGDSYDRRFVGGVCCDGLVSLQTLIPSDGKMPPQQGVPAGCVLESLSRVVCSTCGNDVCDEGENGCNCAADCGRIDAGSDAR